MGLFHFERRHQRLASWSTFLQRFSRNLLYSALVVGGALGIGMAGYAYFEGLTAVDAFLNAAMILSGMGPVATLNSTGGKIFAGCYALASGLIVVATTGLLFVPVLHRVLHHFHAADDAPDASLSSNSERQPRSH